MHTGRWLFGIGFAAAAAALAAGAPAASGSADLTGRVDAVFRDLDRSDSPGCALGVYRDGRILYARGYGMANLELGVANSAQTVFDIGSTSKQFTAFAIHLLARDGKLSLDDDIRKWVPEIPSYGKTITIRELLHHTSGLRDYIELMDLRGIRTEDVTTEAEALALMARQRAPNFAPGTEHLYCNTGYFLLSVVVRRASGRSLREFAADRIFAPLGMRHTQFNDSHTRVVPGRATGYEESAGGAGAFVIDMSDWEQTGDGAVLTSVEDLFRWDANFYDPRVGDRRLIQEMLTPGVLNDGRKLDYASALQLSTYRGLPTVSHGGSWAGYRAQLLRFPEQHLSVACLCNLGSANPSRRARSVAEVFLSGMMKPEAPVEAGQEAEKAEFAVSRSALERLTGAYRDPVSGAVLILTLPAERLVAEFGGRKHTLVAAGPAQFRDQDFPDGRRLIVFEPAAGGARARIRITTIENGRTQEQELERAELWKPSAGELASLAGAYRSEELDTTWRLAFEDGRLFLRYRTAPVEALAPTVADTLAVGGMVLHLARDASGRVSGFTVDEGRVRGIGFARVQDPGGA
jgi:CubicO group peptidase (beta-lactamase class C family)